MNWTDSQNNAIYKNGCNILVSAGAGSGKTAVLSARTIETLKKGVLINSLLILTFTRASANEMKERIRKSIKENNMLEQLKLLDSSYITTFDSFSLSIAKRYSYCLNKSNDINISSDNLIKQLLDEVVNKVIDDYYTKNDDLFNDLIRSFCVKDDKLIRDMVIRLYYEVDKMTNYHNYLNNYMNEYFNEDFYNDIKTRFTEVLLDKIVNLQEKTINLMNESDGDVYEGLNVFLNDIKINKKYENIKKIVTNFVIPRKTKACSEDYSKVRGLLKSDIDNLLTFMRYENLDDIITEYKKTYNHSKVIINILKDVYFKIDEIKKEKNLYTFNDVAKMAIRIIKENDWVKEELKNEFHEIMIDEYQDTSDIQEEFINLISNNNVYAVGDIKQSIYRFRNANPLLFKMKYDKYSNEVDKNKGYKIDLLENFRSRKEVLKSVNDIFKVVMSDQIGGANYIDHHQMKYGNLSYLDLNSFDYNLEVIDISNLNNEYSRNIKEIFSVATDIKQRMSNGDQVFIKGKPRKLNYEDFCILLDRSTDFDLYKSIFEYMGIPLNVQKEEKLTSGYDYQVILNIMKFILLISDRTYNTLFKYLFTSIARSFVFRLSDEEIFQYVVGNNIYESLIYKKAINIANDINKLSPLQYLERIVDEFDIYSNVIRIGNAALTFRKIEYLSELAIELGLIGYNVKGYVEHLDKAMELNIDIGFKTGTSSNDAVNLMTIHASKGLEFPICYYAGLDKSFNRSDIKERFLIDSKKTIIIPYFENGIKETALKDIYKFEYDYEEISEKIRLFYVALTRSKEKIIIVDDLSSDFSLEVSEGHKLRFRSFADIMNSVYANIDYINTKSCAIISRDYLFKDIKNYQANIPRGSIIKTESLEFKLDKSSNMRYSKTINKILSKEEIKNINLGLEIHKLLENLNLKDNNLINKIENMNLNSYTEEILLRFCRSGLLDNINSANVYREYEFINDNKTGIIDLMLEFDDYIDIIDYKLKDTSSEAYLLQLSGYKEYISRLTNKKVNIYLYSLIEGKIVKL